MNRQARPTAARPTERELDVLEALWRRGPSTVREVLEELGDAHEAGYTSLQKIMTIMLDKGLVARQPEGRVHRYRPLVAREAVQRNFASEMLERVFGGSVTALVQSALASRPASAEELSEVRALLEEAERTEPSEEDA